MNIESYVPEILLIVIGVLTSRIVARFPSLEKEYKDIVALGVSIAATFGLWAVNLVNVDVIAQYTDSESTWATVLASSFVVWIVSQGWWEIQARRKKPKVSAKTGRPADDETEGLPQEFEC